MISQRGLKIRVYPLDDVADCDTLGASTANHKGIPLFQIPVRQVGEGELDCEFGNGWIGGMHTDVGWHTACGEVGSEGRGMNDVPAEVSVMEIRAKMDGGCC